MPRFGCVLLLLVAFAVGNGWALGAGLELQEDQQQPDNIADVGVEPSGEDDAVSIFF